jgi:uncharacterized membrane protein
VGVLANGLGDRVREVKVSRVLAAAAGGYLLLMFIAPLAMPEGTVPELSGRANTFDYATASGWGNQDNGEGATVGHDQSAHGGTFAWTELNPVWGFVYAVGDLNCHQKYERSWKINGNQMPMCTRDVGIFFGFVVGAALFGWRGLNRWTVRDTFLSIFPNERLEPVYLSDRRMTAMLAIIGLGLLPMAVDGFTQMLTDYESTHLVRLVTGFAAGLVVGWWFSSSLSARTKYFGDDPRLVVLPADARLVTK